MWYIRGQMELEGQTIRLVVDLDEESIYPSLFFTYFNNAPGFNTYGLMLDTLVTETIITSDFLNELSKEKERKEDFTTA